MNSLPTVVARLSDWYNRVQRPLPWRASHDPYRIWISEVMLQQTQAATVIPYYERFLERFPNLDALANSPESEVLLRWAGLGYYSRAKNLRKAAQYLVQQHGGNFPKNRKALLEIPGIGPYTAGAVLSIAFDLPEPIVDGNVQRVFARYYTFGEPIESKTAGIFFWNKAQEWVSCAASARILNQALMELGAMVCTKASPKCIQCPLVTDCAGHRTGSATEYPKRAKRRPTQDVWWGAWIQENRGRVLLTQNPEGSWWAGLWDLPRLEANSERAVEKKARDFIHSRPNWKWKKNLPWQKHTVTHHRIRVAPFVVTTPATRPNPPDRQRWVRVEELENFPLSSLAKKILSSYRR